jgi:NapC/NirT cytochrome c family, N-terminal region
MMKHCRRNSAKAKMLSSVFLNSVIPAIISFFFFVGIGFAQSAAAPDEENCLFCHRYPQMGRYDETGKKRVFYIDEKMFANSVHGHLRCKSCHVGLDTIPHTNIKKVDCSTKCHIEEPSTNKEFSHINMIEKFEASVHGKIINGKTKPYAEDLPTCKYCHTNRMYNPFSSIWGKSEALSKETLARCVGCHTREQWAKRFYSHFTHRMRRRRSQTEIIALCTSCHENREKMARHGLESIETYKDTFHFTQVKYGVENAPDCLDCHVPINYSAHYIRPKIDPTSPVYITNRITTCSNQGGLKTCHPGAHAEFASGRVHAYGFKAKIAAYNEKLKMPSQTKNLVAERAEAEIEHKEIFHYKVLKIIRLFYQILIAVVIGSMVVHQMLDYIRTKKRHH